MNRVNPLPGKRVLLGTGAFLPAMMVIGSIWDFPSSKAVYNPSNPFGLFFAGFGEYPAALGFAAAAFSEAGWKADGAVSHWSYLDESGSSIPYYHGRSLFDRHDCSLCGRMDYAYRVMPHFVSHA